MPLEVPLPRGGRLVSRVHRCPGCTHRFLHTTAEQQDAINTGYDDDYSGFREDPVFAERVREAVDREMVPRVPPPARVLDVGCGNGEFLAAAASRGYRVEGIDVSEASAARCRSRGLDARAGDFLEFPFEGDFEIVTMWDVLEHLREPHRFLCRAREVLSSGGCLITKTPGFGGGSFIPIALRNRLATGILGAPAHVQYFTPRSMEALLQRCGFSRLEWMTSRDFRSAPPATRWKQTLGRTFYGAIKHLARNRNLYLAARA